MCYVVFFFFSSRRRHTRLVSDWSSDVCSSDLQSNVQQGDVRCFVTVDSGVTAAGLASRGAADQGVLRGRLRSCDFMAWMGAEHLRVWVRPQEERARARAGLALWLPAARGLALQPCRGVSVSALGRRWYVRLAAGLYVLVDPEEVLGIPLVLELHEPRG